MKVLFVANRPPSLEGKADQITTFQAIDYLKKKEDVELQLCVLDINENNKFLLAMNLTRAIVQTLLTFKPLQVTLYAKPRLKRRLLECVSDYEPDLIYFHLTRSTYFIEQVTVPRKYVGLQVSQYLNFKRASEHIKNPIKKLFYSFESKLSYFYERRLIQKVDGSNFVGSADPVSLGIDPSDKTVFVIPHGVDQPQSSVVISKSNDAIFLANFSSDHNKDALYFLLNEVMPYVYSTSPEFKLTVAGRNIPAGLKRLYPKVNFKPDVKSAHNEIALHKLFINPVRASAGMQNKVLTALSVGVPVLCTKQSVEGMDLPKDIVSLTELDAYSISKSTLELTQLPFDADKAEYSISYIENNWTWDALHKRWCKEFLNIC